MVNVLSGVLTALLWAALHGGAAMPTTTTPTATPPPATAAAAPLVQQILVTNRAIASPLPSTFMGVSLEFRTLPHWSSDQGEHPNPMVVQLIKDLAPGGHPVIRIGGTSTERSWWPVKGMTRPPGINYTLGTAWMNSVRTLAQATGAQLLLTVNLAADSVPIAQAEAAAYLKDIGPDYISALELGNEPEFYSHVAWYRHEGSQTLPWYSTVGTPVYARAASYGAAQWSQQYAQLLNALPSMAIAGPDSGNTQILNAFESLLHHGSDVDMMTSHAYALTNCQTNPALSSYPSIANLLSPLSSRALFFGQLPYIAFAHAAGAKFREDELGSVSCNGKAGVSNTFASALWLTDALMTLDAAGVDGVNLHTFPHEINNLFDIAGSTAHPLGLVHPLFYGALLFAQAAPVGSRLVALTAPGPTVLRAWATLAPDRSLRVLLINDDQSDPLNTRIAVPAGYGTRAAQLTRMTAPSAAATGGVSIGGRSFGVTTSTGLLAAPIPNPVSASDGAFNITLPPASAALLTLPAP